MMKNITIAALALMLAVPVMAGAQTVSSNLSSVVVDNAINLSGTCPGSTSGTATFTMTGTAGTAVIGQATVGADGSFSAPNVGVPASVGIGGATITVTCPDGATAVRAITVIDAADAGITVSDTTLSIGESVTISGFCPVGDVGEAVTLALIQNGTVTVLGSATVRDGGAFSGTVTIPGTAVSGGASLSATCPMGRQITTGVTIVGAAAADVPVLTPTGPGGGVPEGAVAAGKADSNLLLALAMLISGIALASRKLARV